MKDTDVQLALDRIIEKQRVKIGYEVLDPMTVALEKLKNVYAGLILLPEISAFTVRVETLRTLLDSFMDPSTRPYNERLRQAGFSVGQSFSEDFFRSLEEIEMIPTDYPQVVRLWLQIEHNANWGTFSVRDYENGFFIVADDTFLTRGLDKEVHRHCEFMSGYFDGFLWGILPMFPRWFRATFKMPSGQSAVRVDSVEHKSSGSKCNFDVKLKWELLVDAIDKWYQATLALRGRDQVEFATQVRASIESALKVKIGRPVSDRTNFSPIIRAYKEFAVLDAGLHDRIKDAFGKTSGAIHSGNKITDHDCRQIMGDTWELIRVLELKDLSEMRKQQLNKMVEEMKTARSAESKS
jgi:hypothetical protein